ncbi:MAG: DUF1707 domain-containing protein [Streptosporangiales bacterium]|nr:DUF1707 domain-containing protein [Streptosporangiales bacterium]
MAAETPESARQGRVRASHADREAVVEQLREAAAEGRIDLDELDTRLDLALTAKTFADLAPLTADLPPVAPPDPGRPLVIKGGMHGAERSGRWKVPARITVRGGMGGAKLDFTQTECHLPEVEVEVDGQMAGVTIVIPDGWAIEPGETDPGLGGLKNKTTPDRLPGTPLIRLSGTGGAAGVVIRHPNRWERRKERRRQER